jgi:hypothetical protein
LPIGFATFSSPGLSVAVGIPWRRHDHKGNKQGLRCAGAQLGVADNERE